MDGGEKMEKYTCCFCGESVESKISTLVVAVDWDNFDEEEQMTQQLFCHTECLKKSLYKPEYLYIDEE